MPTKDKLNIMLAPLVNGAMGPYALSMAHVLSVEYVITGETSPILSSDPLLNIESLSKPSGIRKIFWAFSLNNVSKILKISSGNNLFIINGEFIPFVLFLLIACRFFDINTFLIWHDVEAHPGKKANKLLNILSYLNAMIAKNVMVHSKHYLKDLSATKLFQNKVVYIPLPPYGLPIFTKRMLADTLDYFPKNGYWLFVGSIEYYKGLHNLIKVFKVLPDFNLIIAGKGDSSYSKIFVSDVIQDSPNIKFINAYIDEYEMHLLIKKSNGCILPYLQASQSTLPYLVAEIGGVLICRANIGISETVEELGGHLYTDDNELVRLISSDLLHTKYSRQDHLTQINDLLCNYEIICSRE